jgi:hypothetical protein
MEYDAGKAAVRCIYAAVAIATALTVVFWGEWFAIVLSWILAIPLSLVLGTLYGFVGSMLGYRAVDAEDGFDGEFDDDEIDIEEDPRFWLNDDDSDIEYSDETVGTYKDAKIHEWVLIDNPTVKGEKVKCLYETVVDLDNGFNPPDGRWFILLEPGILYVADPEPENTATNAETVE